MSLFTGQSAHALSIFEHQKKDCGAEEECDLVSSITVSFTSYEWLGMCMFYLGKRRHQDALWERETLSPGIHVGIFLTPTTYLCVSGMVWGRWQRAQGADPASRFLTDQRCCVKLDVIKPIHKINAINKCSGLGLCSCLRCSLVVVAESY